MKRIRGSAPAVGVALGIVIGLATACGTDAKKHGADASAAADSQEGFGQGAVEGATVDHVVTPPKEYYDALLQEQLRLADDDGWGLADAAGAPQVLWVNFDGATLSKGFGRGQSFILCKPTATVPPSGVKAEDRPQILKLVAAHYAAAGAKLVVTATKPASGDYTTMHVGGSYGDLGCLGAGVLGVAPFDKGNTNRNDIGFAFTPRGVTPKIIAETISHEAGHSFGLDHVTDKTDIMFASSSPAVSKFGVAPIQGSGRVQDEPAILKGVLGLADGSATPPDGANVPSQPDKPAPTPTPTPTPNGGQGKPIPLPMPQPNAGGNPIGQIPGLGQLADLAKLLPALGGGALPDLTQLLPALGQLLPGLGGAAGGLGGALPGLDKIVALDALLKALKGQGGALPAGLDANALKDLFAKVTGQAGGLDILKDLLGGAGGGLPDLLKLLLKGAGGLGLPAGGVPGLPDLTGLAGLAGVKDPATLVKSFPAAVTHVNQTYAGDEKDALLSLLKVAYAQAMAKAGAGH